MIKYGSSDVRMFIGGHEVKPIGEEDLKPVVIKSKCATMKLSTQYIGCKNGEGNPKGYHLWIVQACTFKIYPVFQAYWVKPTKKQLRKFKRYIRKHFQY